MSGAIYNMIVAIVGIIVFLIMVIKIFKVPGNLLKKILYNMIAGFVFLLLLNMFGGIWGFKIGINLITVAISAFVGIPGVVALIIIKLIVW
jgi:inhibitor of the pro-sigma K processing machinery